MHEWYYTAIWWQRITVLGVSGNLVSFCSGIWESVKIWKAHVSAENSKDSKLARKNILRGDSDERMHRTGLLWLVALDLLIIVNGCGLRGNMMLWKASYLYSHPFYYRSTTLWKKGNDTQIWKLTSHFFLHHMNVKLWNDPQHSEEMFANPFWCGQRLLWVGWNVGG